MKSSSSDLCASCEAHLCATRKLSRKTYWSYEILPDLNLPSLAVDEVRFAVQEDYSKLDSWDRKETGTMAHGRVPPHLVRGIPIEPQPSSKLLGSPLERVGQQQGLHRDPRRSFEESDQ